MKKIFITFLLFAFSTFRTYADEGMWLLQLLQNLNEKDMKKLGMKISAADIYSINKSSLKDAIVSFGGFCTGVVVSDKGLLFTNHHCGFDAIQNHSSVQKNYLKDGFWASNTSRELKNPALFATFIVRIEDVTSAVTKGVTAAMNESERQSQVDKNIADLKKGYKKEVYEDLLVKPFFDGNKYFLFVTETYKDVRLVGAPPSSIGNFGSDTDNWMWPRHTGDFSVFRIYADKNNKPAAYAPDNVPYKPKRSLKISLDGLQENDFTMVFGFPGATKEYLPAIAVKQTMEMNDPTKIEIRGRALELLRNFMRKDEHTNIQYADKYRKIENAYKKWQGEVLGLKKTNAVEKKAAYESKFTAKVNANLAWKDKYGNVLADLTTAYNSIQSLSYARDYYTEIIPKVEILEISSFLNGLIKAYEKDASSYENAKDNLLKKLEDTYKEFDVNVDKAMFAAMMQMYVEKQEPLYVSPVFMQMVNEKEKTYTAIAEPMYASSSLTSLDKMKQLLSGDAADVIAKIKEDPAFKLYADMQGTYAKNVSPRINELQAQINKLQRLYMEAQMEVFTDKRFYPDANSTLRVSYGNVKGYTPKDGVSYSFYTYLDGVMEKYVPGDYEFDVPQKLKELYEAKDFGQYGINGRQPVCFIASNHTTGGNSGSPALDGYGNLVGLNFDRVWEGTMSDINYDPTICRNIMVDIRYVLFIIDKFAGAQNLVNELTLVHPKKAAIKTPAKK